MDAYAKIFMELLRYVPYLKDEKVRIQCFLSGLPQPYQDQIELRYTSVEVFPPHRYHEIIKVYNV
jgi:hypothetical protein